MIGLDSQAPIWLRTEPTDMRKSFRGLSALVRNQLQNDPLSGQYFVFVNRRKTQMKMLYLYWGRNRSSLLESKQRNNHNEQHHGLSASRGH